MASPADKSHRRRVASFLDETTPPSRVDAKRQIALALARIRRVAAPTCSPRRWKVGRVTAACVVFAIAAFSSGLFLAHVSFNTPDRPLVVTSQPELLYLPPEASAAALLGFTAPQNQSLDTTPRLFSPRAAASPIVSTQADTAILSAAAEVEADQQRTAMAQPSERKLDVGALAQTFSDSAGFALAARAQSAQNANPFLSGYQALEMSVIPEPSSGIVVAIVAAAILASAARRRRRAITPL